MYNNLPQCKFPATNVVSFPPALTPFLPLLQIYFFFSSSFSSFPSPSSPSSSFPSPSSLSSSSSPLLLLLHYHKRRQYWSMCDGLMIGDPEKGGVQKCQFTDSTHNSCIPFFLIGSTSYNLFLPFFLSEAIFISLVHLFITSLSKFI